MLSACPWNKKLAASHLRLGWSKRCETFPKLFASRAQRLLAGLGQWCEVNKMSGELPGHSTAVTQSIAKKVFQVGDCVNLLDCRIYVVLNATVANRFAIEEDIAGAPIAVARLADRADIAKGLAPVQVVDVIDFLRTMELQGFGEY